MRPFCIAFALAAALFAGAAQAQQFPTKAVTLIVPFAPGGSNDILARALGERLNKIWGQPVVIENKPGAGATLGIAAAAKAAPDGYTLVIASVTFTMVPAVRENLPYDPANDLLPVAKIGGTPLLAAVGPGLPAKNLKELIQLAKAGPDKYSFAATGTGSVTHFAAVKFMKAAGLKLTHVNYKGGGPAMVDVMGGHAGMYIGTAFQMVPHVKSGKMTAIAVTGGKRLPSLPDVATFDELGLKGVDIEQWWGILAPKGTPKAVVDKLNTDINKVLATEDMKQLLAKDGAEATPMPQAKFAAFVKSELDTYRALAKEANITAK